MPSKNYVLIIGHLGRDPEVKHLQNNTPLANFTVATSERWKDKNTGEWKEQTEWHRVVAWRAQAERVERYNIRKGSLVMVEGKLTTRKYTDQNGVEKYTTEIVANSVDLLEKREKQDGAPYGGGQADDNDLPF